jgi:hypothetical protein
MSQPSNTIPGCGASKIQSNFSAIHREFRTVQSNSEEIYTELDNIYKLLDRI